LPEFLQQKLQPKEGVIIDSPADASVYFKEKPEFNSLEEELEFEAKN